ncbi:MAG: hypothetical protein GY775_03555 [Candidatus Scalindua sp.]|nr:hypothetical protein [Candidatus Scalindua sp.]
MKAREGEGEIRKTRYGKKAIAVCEQCENPALNKPGIGHFPLLKTTKIIAVLQLAIV